MPKQLADAVEQWAEERELPVQRTDDRPPYVRSYLVDGTHVDADLPQRELDRRFRRASKIVAVMSDGSREVQKDGAKN